MRSIKNTYFIVLSTLFFLLISLIVTHIFLKIYYKISINYSYTHSSLSDHQQESYAHMSESEIKDLLNSTWGYGWEYEPWTGFREKKRNTNFVNINENGIRLNKKNEVIKLDQSIWFFGGSTTFGYGVADFETIPAYLNNRSNTNVINFGRGYYYSAQENLLLTQFLKKKIRPKKVIFLDGVNEACDLITYQNTFKFLFNKAQKNYFWNYREIMKPIIYLSERIKSKIIIKEKRDLDSYKDICKTEGFDLTFEEVINSNLKERDMICNFYNIKCITFLQPFPVINSPNKDISEKKDMMFIKNLKNKYSIIENIFIKNNAIILDKVFINYDHHAFVDGAHYNSKANEMIANEIFNKLN